MPNKRSSGEGSIIQRRDGRWQASLQLDGARRTVYGVTRQEAAGKLAELQRQVATAGRVAAPGRRTLAALLDAWLETKTPTLKSRTAADYAEICARYLAPALGHLPLARIAPDAIERLCASYQRAGQPRTALKVYRILSQALDCAVRWGWLAHNPCGRVDTPRYRPERKSVWTPQELQAFLQGTEAHWLHPLWVVAIATGCRLGELLALTWADVDMERAALSIAKSAQRIKGERVTTAPKTRSGNRRMALPAEAVAALRRQQAQQAVWRLQAETWNGQDLVFTSRKGRPLAASVAEWAIQQACERLALPRVTPHGLRHLSASLLLAGGLAIPAVAARLGHASPAITMSVYAHAVSGSDDAAARALQSVLSGKG